jgi:hypothetical protein
VNKKAATRFTRALRRGLGEKPMVTVAKISVNGKLASGRTTNSPLGEEREELAPAKSTYRKSKQGGICPAFSKLKELFKRHYYFSDDDVIDVTLGVVAGNHFDNDPLWLYLIGPPSAGKTELLMSLFECKETHFESDITPAGLISGYRDEPGKTKPDDGKKGKGKGKGSAPKANTPEPEKDYSLLPKLDGKVLIVKDFTLIHDKPADTRAQILAIFRDVYDGYSSRKFGNSDSKGYHSKFNFLAGMTPDIEKAWSLNTLGERFLMYRIWVENRREHARQALNNVRNGSGYTGVRKQLQGEVRQFMDNLERYKPLVDDETAEKILDLAEVLSTCRTYVYRDRNDDMPCLPQAEMAARVAKQLMRIGMSVALVRGRERVGEEEVDLMRRVALDSLPANRRLLLQALYECKSPMGEPLARFAEAVPRISSNSVRRELENLSELGAVERLKQQVALLSGKPKADGTAKQVKTTKELYKLAERFREYCDNVGVIPPY